MLLWASCEHAAPRSYLTCVMLMPMQGLAYYQQWGGMRVAMATSCLALVHAEHLAAKNATYAAQLTNYAKYQVRASGH